MIRIKMDEERVDITDLLRIKKDYGLDDDEFLSIIRSNPELIDVSMRDTITIRIVIAAGIILKVLYQAKLVEER